MVLIFFSFFITFFHEILFLGKSFFVGDGIFIYAPHKIFIFESIKNGVLPFWNPHLWSGFPEIGDMVLGLFDPFNLIYFLFPGTIGVNIVVLASYLLAFGGTYLFLKNEGLTRDASLTGAIIFTFSGSMLNISPDPIRLESICFLPWLLMAAKNGRFLTALILLVLNFLVGQSQYFYMNLCFVFGDLFFYSHKKKLIMFLIAVLLTGGLTAFTILPQLELLPFSSRAAANIAYNTIWSLNPASLIRFFLADFWGKQTTGFSWGPNVTYSFGYIGFIPLILILLNLRHINRRNCFFAVAAATSLLISFGKYNPFYGVFLLIPGFALFRNPSSWLTIYSFSLACLFAYIFDKTNFDREKCRKSILFFLGIFMLLIGIFFYMASFSSFAHSSFIGISQLLNKHLSVFHDVQTDQKIFYFIGRNLSLLGILLLMSWIFKFKKSIFVLIIFFDLFFFSRGDFFISDFSNNIFPITSSSEQVKFLQKNLSTYRFVSTANFLPYHEIRTENYYQKTNLAEARDEYQNLFALLPSNIFVAYQISSINGYSTFMLQNYYQYFKRSSPNLSAYALQLEKNRSLGENLPDPTKINFDNIRLDDPRLSELSVQYILSSEDIPYLNTKKYRKIILKNNLFIYENKLVKPRAQIFDKDNHSVFTPSIHDINANEIKINLNSYHASASDYLLLRDTYYPGWQAFDQNNNNLDIAATGPFRKIMLNRSIKQVHFTYAPRSFYTGLEISLGTLILLTCYLFAKAILKKK